MKKISTFKKIKNFFKSFWFNYVKKFFYDNLILKKLNKKREQEKIIKTKKEFKNKYNISSDRVKDIMFIDKEINENLPKNDYHNNKLIEGREHVNTLSKYMNKTPFFYEPEIIEIHNENLNKDYPTLDRLIKIEEEMSKNLLKKQETRKNRVLNKKIKK